MIDFENPDGKLLPGETAYVTIPTGHVEDCIRVPNSALRYTPILPPRQVQQMYAKSGISPAAATSHAGGKHLVWKIEDGQIHPVAVQVGITDYTNTQLLSGDLKPGDVLAAGEGTSSGEVSRPAAAPKFGAPKR